MLKKIHERTLDEIGKREYDFNFEEEKNIYCCLCRWTGYKSTAKNVKQDKRFNSYKEWKEYVGNKSMSWDLDKLTEFSRYLNQRLRILKPGFEVGNLFITILLTLIIEDGVEQLWKSEEIVKTLTNPIARILVMYLVLIVLVLLILGLIYFVLSPYWNNSLKEYLILDYLEIIEERRKKLLEKKNQTN